jgi:uncharacterized protein YbaA (DUF1428 family)
VFRTTSPEEPPVPYVDGFVIPIPRRSLKAYRRMAAAAGRVWMRHGALEFKECVLEDPARQCGLPFGKLTKVKRGETVLFSFIVFRSRAHRDRVNDLVMKDPRLAWMAELMATDLFDTRRMSYGGFQALVSL